MLGCSRYHAGLMPISPPPQRAGPPASSTASLPAPALLQPQRVALAGLVSLAVAMGIGRFAFTPLLPMMLHDGPLDLTGGSWLASVNYLGYLLGALLCSLQPWIWARLPLLPVVRHTSWVRIGLVATCLLTLAMALPWPGLWPWLRFASGLASALAFVYTSGWCLARLAVLGRAEWGGLIYTGPGAGIALSGLLASAMVALGWPAAWGWVVFGLLACVLVAWIWPTLGRGSAPAATAAPAAVLAPLPAANVRSEMRLLALAYGLSGFGYIITATFLPVIARDALPGSVWLDLFWPLFGLGVMAGAVLATRFPLSLDRRLLLAGCYLLQALGVAASAWSPTLGGFVLGSLLVGLPFTALTLFAMQEARRLAPVAAASFMGLLTAVYGTGQILGPLMVPWVMQRSSSRAAGFTTSLEVAAAALVLGALVFGWMLWRYPLGGRVASAEQPPHSGA